MVSPDRQKRKILQRQQRQGEQVTKRGIQFKDRLLKGEEKLTQQNIARASRFLTQKQVRDLQIKRVANSIEERIKQRKRDIERSRKRERESDSDRVNDREDARQKGYRAEIRELERRLNEVKQGKLYDPQSVIRSAKNIGKAEEREERAETRQKRAISKALPELLEKGNVTSIEYKNGVPSRATINGKRVSLRSLPKSERKKVELNVVKDANFKKKVETFSNQGLTVGQLRNKGLTFREIAAIGRKEEIDKIKQDSQNRKLTDKELKRLGLNQKTISEIKKIKGDRLTVGELRNKGFKFSEIANVGRIQSRRDFIEKNKKVLQQQKKLQDQIKRIRADKSLGTFEKENKLRELIGIPAADTQINKRLKNVLQSNKKNALTRELLGERNYNTITAGNLKGSKLNSLERALEEEYKRIAAKPVGKRTTQEMALVSTAGLSSVALGTIRKVPGVAWSYILTLIRPDLVAKGIWRLVTDKNARSDFKRTLREQGQALSRGDPDAVSTLTSEFLGFKAGNKIILEAGKAASVSPIVRRAQEAKFVLSQPDELKPYVKEILKAARIQEKLKPSDLKGIKKVNFNEVLELNKVEARALEKTLKETDSFVFGSLASRTLSKGKTKIPKDVDLATKNKEKFIKKFISNLPKKDRKLYKIGKDTVKKGNLKLLDIKTYARLRPDQTIFGQGRLPINTIVYKTNKPRLKQAGLKIPTRKLVDIGGIKLVGFGEQTSRKALGTLQVILEKTGRRAKDPAAFIESLELQLAALKGKIPKSGVVKKYLLNRKAKDLENAIKILKSKKFQNLLEKKAPGITKEFPILTKIKKLTSKQKTKITKSVNKAIDKLRKKKKDTKPKKKSKRKVFKTKKAAEKKGFQVYKVKGGWSRRKTKKTKKSSKTPKSKIPKSRVPKSKIAKSKTPKSRTPKSKTPKSKTPKSKIRTSKTPGSRTPRSKTTSSKIAKSKTPPSRTPRSKTPSSKTPPSKTPPSKVPPTKTKKIPTRTKKLKRSKNQRNAYEVVILEGERIVRRTSTPLPLNRAKNLLRDRLDNSIRASGEIRPQGKTNILDVKPKNSRKFRTKRSKGTKVLKIVEKKKFRLDSPAEKKTIQKARKKTNNKKATKKKKSSKKSSNTNRKVFKTKTAAKRKGFQVYKVKGGWSRRKV